MTIRVSSGLPRACFALEPNQPCYAGMESSPSLSPDGSQVAFSWNGETGSQIPDLYVKATDAPKPLRLTDTPDDYEWCPTWSPDGKYLAFAVDILQWSEGRFSPLVP